MPQNDYISKLLDIGSINILNYNVGLIFVLTVEELLIKYTTIELKK